MILIQFCDFATILKFYKAAITLIRNSFVSASRFYYNFYYYVTILLLRINFIISN